MRNDLEFLKENLKVLNKLKNRDQKGFLELDEQTPPDIIYDAEDIIEECVHMFGQGSGSLMTCISFIFSRGNWKRIKKLQQIKKYIRRYKEQIDLFLELYHNLSNQQLSKRNHFIQYPILIHGDEVVGLDKDVEKIKQWVLKANGPLKMIGIWGMGGVGKTTLAQKVCKDRSVKEYFDCILFITVPLSVDLKELLKDILLKMNVNKISLRGDELELLEELYLQLNQKRYLIILDGVWQIDERSWWSSLKSALPLATSGNCVIITTRLKEVARLMGVTEKHLHYHETLSGNNSWLLFAKIVFPREDSSRSPDPNMEAIAKEIAAKCGGLPLAIKVIAGGMLRKEFSIYNWRMMAQNLNEEWHTKSELLDFALRRSYEELPPHFKRCMLCFSIFPEGYEISLEEVVHLWSTRGLIHKTEGKTMFENGEEWFDELINKCLLIGERKDIFETRYQTCRVHGMIQKMIVKIVLEKNFKEGMSFFHSTGAKYIWGSDMDHIKKLKSKLWLLVGREITENREFVSNMKPKILKQKWLRVLDISFTLNDLKDEVLGENWLDGIKSFPMLTCLKIKNSRLGALPKSIMALRDLQTLCLFQCYNLKKLPLEVGHLEKLTMLDVSSCASLEYLPKQIENLSNLEILFGFRPSCSRFKGGCHMASLKKLTQLRKLWIQIDSEDQIDKEDLVVLSELRALKVLAITLEDNNNSALIRKLDCELPSPLEQLSHLYLHYFPGVENPRWLNPISLPNLSFLHIYESNIRSFSTSFFGNKENLWQLEALVLTDLNELQEEWPRVQTSMPCLRLLKVDECPKLKSLPCSVENGLGCWMK